MRGSRTTPTWKPSLLLKSPNFGQNWSWSILPEHLKGLGDTLEVDPTNSSTLYAVTPDCVARSYDGGETWAACWNASGLEGKFHSLAIKDSKTMILLRDGDVPLRTKDGGSTWQPLTGLQDKAQASHWAKWSWTGKTLVVGGSDRGAIGRGEKPGYIWRSTDDGDTWVDETGDVVTNAVNGCAWFDDTFYLFTAGEGISSKVLEPKDAPPLFV